MPVDPDISLGVPSITDRSGLRRLQGGVCVRERESSSLFVNTKIRHECMLRRSHLQVWLDMIQPIYS